jgi:RNA polymerase sigma-70 factor (ECF subfamily)
MPTHPDGANTILEQYRAHLECLTSIQINPRLRSKFGMSDIIQKTLLEAYQSLEQIEAMGSEDRKRWLRRMLINNLREEIDKYLTAGRDVALEQPLRSAAEESSGRLNDWLAADDTSPGARLAKHEQALRLVEALAQLDPRQREALILQRWHGWKLAEIAEHLQCTTGVVAGLHARGLAQLRKLLPEDMECP